jgi:protein-disulfide isomerase
MKKFGIGLVALVLLAVVGYGFGLFGSTEDPADSSGVVPSFVDETSFAWVLNPDSKSSMTLEVWEDPQCVYCGDFEKAFSAIINEMVASDTVKVAIRPTSFLDSNIPGENSARAINAWACAVDAGIGKQYHDAMYANQPVEGKGWTNADLVAVAKTAGLMSEKESGFTDCVNSGEFGKWSKQSTQEFFDLAIPGTPHVSVNGDEITVDILKSGDPAAFKAWVFSHA